MSTLKYNGITLPYCWTPHFSQEAVYDKHGEEPTDLVYTKIDLTVQAVLNSAYTTVIGSNSNPASGIMYEIRPKLLKPRQSLSYFFNGVNLLPGRIGAGPIDAKNGPQPQSCIVTPLTNNTFLITYRIIAHYWENQDVGQVGGPNKAGNDCISNRWSESVDIDGRNYSIRTRTGKCIIRSDNAGSKIADEIRTQMAVVGVPHGFLRDSSNYTQSPDGLGLAYTVRDREVYLTPPFPSFKATGKYSESLTNLGTQRAIECWVRLEGQSPAAEKPSYDPNKLARLAVELCASKVENQNNQVDSNGVPVKPPILNAGSLSFDLYDNVAECRLQYIGTAGSNRVKEVASFDYTRLTSVPIGSRAGEAKPTFLPRGGANMLLQAAAYYDPSLVNLVVDPADRQLTEGALVGTAGGGE